MALKFFNLVTKKTLIFGFAGAIGALIFALLAEPLIYLLPKVEEPSQIKADVVFVIDATGSMAGQINGVKNGIKSFAHAFSSKNIDLNVGAVWFRDRFSDSNALSKINFNGQDVTNDYVLFSSEIDKVVADGGGDGPESSIDAVDLASTLVFRNDTQKILILITDAEPKSPDVSGKTINDIKESLLHNSISQLHLAINSEHASYYQPLQEVAKGEIFSLQDISSGSSGFEKAMPTIGAKIAEGISTVASTNKFNKNAAVGVVATFTLWWGLVGLGTSLLLITAQNRYLKKGFDLKKLFTGGTTGLVIGLFSGLIPQLFFIDALILKILAWGLIGSGIGWAVSKIVPNYPINRAALGGLIGGIAGGISFVIFSFLFPDMIARLMGAAVVGFFIGLMISLLEEVLREAWLTVEYNPQEKRNIALGEKPLILGSSPEADIYLPKAQNFPPITAMVKIENGKLWFENKINNQTTELENGKKIQLGTITIFVHIIADINKQ
jgi:Ca-activated chloride channel family protein